MRGIKGRSTERPFFITLVVQKNESMTKSFTVGGLKLHDASFLSVLYI